MKINENLAYLRAKTNISRYRLAKELNVNESLLRKIENGSSKNPRIDTVLKISLYFGVSIDDFVNKDMSKVGIKGR